ncbi:MAG: hypothetical protein ABWX68_10565 [Arthrobacter sp.]|uniref:hypothetical protein n=1 Tax=Arthrobacter sp. TaxID=1667 RepID=UPI00349B6A2D
MVFASAHILFGEDGEESAEKLVPPGASKDPVDGGYVVTAEFASQTDAVGWLGEIAAVGKCAGASIWSQPPGESPVVYPLPRATRTALVGPHFQYLTTWDPGRIASAFANPKSVGNEASTADSASPAISPQPTLPPDPETAPGEQQTLAPPAITAASALVAGLAMKPPEDLFGGEKQSGAVQEAADAGISGLAADQRAIRRSLMWSASREHALFEVLDDSGRAALATDWLRASAGLDAHAQRVAVARAAEAEARAARYLQFNELVGEVVKDRKMWRALAPVAIVVLIVTLIVAYNLTTTVIGKIGTEGMSGWEAAILVFVFALVAISPVVLLLLERPLAGIDAWSPSGPQAPSSGAEAEKPREGAVQADSKKKK